ncbi:hypothetical protein ACTNDU_12560 [Hallella faecis]|uniref:hypothetical protein n=1 Tax=Hallella faecis TaxID=2841596 RepID=UPI003F893A20
MSDEPFSFLLMPAFLVRAFLGGGWGGVALVGFLIRVKNAPPLLKKNLKDLPGLKKVNTFAGLSKKQKLEILFI